MTPYDRARSDLGTWEWKDGHNPKVVQYFADVGQEWVRNDETAWCAAFVGAMLERCQINSTRRLNARSYLEWGDPVSLDEARPGDIVVFSRGNPKGWQGHVGFFVRSTGSSILCLGGNQNNQVNEAKYPATRLLGIRRIPSLTPPPPDAPPAVEIQPQGLWARIAAAFQSLRRG